MKKRVLMSAFSVTLLFVLLCLLVACGGKDDPVAGGEEGPFVPEHFEEDPALEIYSQRAHIGFEQSLKNVAQFKDYYASGAPAFVIPGLNEGENFVLQGVAFGGEHNIALLAGYVKPATENVNSVIFVIDMSKYVKVGDGEYLQGALSKEILLDKADGSAYTGHAGGIAVSKNNVWLANDSKLFYIPIADILSAPATSHIALENSIDVPVNASYAEFSEDTLWVGEFEYARDKYVTDASHHDEQDSSLTAWTVGYRLDESGKAGYDSATGIKSEALKDVAVPDIVLWHCEKVQGMTAIGMPNGDLKVLLSTSYGRTNTSNLRTYKVPAHAASPLSVDIAGASVPCFKLTDGETMSAPPMLEDIAHMQVGKRHYVLLASESGSFNYHGAENSVSLFPTDLVWKLEIA